MNADIKSRRETLTAARQHLAAVTARTTEETDELLDANEAVVKAEEQLKPWQRFDIELRQFDGRREQR